jgi:transposase-like protein
MAKKKPTELTEQKIKAICKAITLGANVHVAASAANIDRKTLYNWRQKGKNSSSGMFYDLVKRMEVAENQFITNNLQNLSRHSNLSWQASAWLLERRHPELFAKITERRELDELKKEVQAIRGEMARNSVAQDEQDDGK